MAWRPAALQAVDDAAGILIDVAAGGIGQQQHRIGILGPAPGGADHGAVEPAARREDAGGIDEHQLGPAADGDAEDAHAGGLHLRRDDGDLGADQDVQQGRLADIGGAEDGDEAAAVGRWRPGAARAMRGSSAPASGRRAAGPGRRRETERWTPCPAGNAAGDRPGRRSAAVGVGAASHGRPTRYGRPWGRIRHQDSKFKAIVFCVGRAAAASAARAGADGPPTRRFTRAPAFVRSTMSKTEPVESGATSNVNIMRTYATRVKRDRPGRDDGTRVLEKRESAMSD